MEERNFNPALAFKEITKELFKKLITKEQFKEIMTLIKRQKEFDDKAVDAFNNDILLCSTSIGYNNEKIYEAAIKLLEYIFNDYHTEKIDMGSFIEYFIYELNFGEKYTSDSLTDMDGNIIDISTIDLFYDFLVDNI